MFLKRFSISLTVYIMLTLFSLVKVSRLASVVFMLGLREDIYGCDFSKLCRIGRCMQSGYLRRSQNLYAV